MSYVNNALLSYGVLEYDVARMAEVNAKLAELDEHRHQQFGRGDEQDWYGGTKVMEKSLWGAAFNYVDLEIVMQAVRSAEWEHPAEVQLFWCGQDDDIWAVHTLGGDA